MEKWINAERSGDGWKIYLENGESIKPDKYVVTGTDVYGKRFRRQFGKSDLHWALGINLYNGSLFAVCENKRRLLRRVRY
jgi:hypothetical protein